VVAASAVAATSAERIVDHGNGGVVAMAAEAGAVAKMKSVLKLFGDTYRRKHASAPHGSEILFAVTSVDLLQGCTCTQMSVRG
jgi:hypothetical protein